jgi:hypothetical protein
MNIEISENAIYSRSHNRDLRKNEVRSRNLGEEQNTPKKKPSPEQSLAGQNQKSHQKNNPRWNNPSPHKTIPADETQITEVCEPRDGSGT